MPRGAGSEARYRAKRGLCECCHAPKPSGRVLCDSCWALVPSDVQAEVQAAYASLKAAQHKASLSARLKWGGR